MPRKISIGIPIRMGSSRFPGKPLAPILGKTMMEHVYMRCKLSKSVDEVFYALCDDSTREEAEKKSASYVWTDPNIDRPILRVAEAAKQKQLCDEDIVVIVQGDEPLVHPHMISLSLAPFLNGEDPFCSCLCTVINGADVQDPNTIKVVMDSAGRCLYMSRSAIPSQIHPENRNLPTIYKQVCIMAFTWENLRAFTRLSPSPLEVSESIELLRAVENGFKVQMLLTAHTSQAVDTPADLEQVTQMMQKDSVYISGY